MTALSHNDLNYLSYAEWISGDYNEFVKRTILPRFSRRFPLKLREMRVLITISEFNSLKTAGEIAEHLRQDPATVTRAMVILIGKGFVMSKENFHDGRSRILTLTEKGTSASTYFFHLFETALATIPQQDDEETILEVLKALSSRARILQDAQQKLSRLLKNATISTA